MTRRWLLPLLLLLAAPNLAAAQDLDTRIDEAKAEVKADKAARKDDRKDVKAIAKLRKKWEKARARDKVSLVATVDEDLARWIREEIAERRHDVRDARTEYVEGGGRADVGQRGGVSKAGKPIRPSRARTKPSPGDRGERPALADDRTDFERQEGSLERLREIARELEELQPRFDSGSAGGRAEDDKRELLADLEQIATRDLARTEKELAEDEAQLDRLKAKR